jgi:hypothetical protein
MQVAKAYMNGELAEKAPGHMVLHLDLNGRYARAQIRCDKCEIPTLVEVLRVANDGLVVASVCPWCGKSWTYKAGGKA